jgi:hypothetical protein
MWSANPGEDAVASTEGKNVEMGDKGTRAKTHTRDADKVDERKRRAESDLGYAGELAGGLGVFDSLLADPGMELPVEKHAALLSDARFAHPANASHKARMVSQLQSDYGNGHVQRVLESMAVQAKLVVSPPDDEYERQADQIADVAAKPADSRLQRQTEEGENDEDTLATKALGTGLQPIVQRQKEEAGARAPTVTVAQRGDLGAEVTGLSPTAAVLQRQAAPGAVGPGPAALKIKRAFPVERRTKGLKLGPVVLGKTIKGEVSVEGALKAGGGAGPEAEAAISVGAETKAAAELKREITKGLEFKGGVEIGEDSQKIGSGLDLQLYSSGGTAYKAVLDATIFERQGSDITFLAIEVGVSGSTKTVIPLPKSGLTFEGEIGLKVTASVEPHWPTIGRLAARVGARFVGPAASAAATFGAAALPYLVVAAVAVAYFAAIGGGLYMVAEAHRKGSLLGMRRTFAYGYAASLAELIRAGKGESAELTRGEATALLRIDAKAYFEQAMKWRSEGYLIAALDRAEMAGKAAAMQYLNELIKAHGYDAWKEWCRPHKPDEYRSTLAAQAEGDKPIGITIDLKKAPSGAAAKPAVSRLQRRTEGYKEDEGTLATKALDTPSQLAVQRQTEERREVEEGLQTEPTIASSRQAIQRQAEEGKEEEEEKTPLQTRPAGTQASPVSETLETRITGARRRGRPMDDHLQAEFEYQFGRSLSDVRIHTDAEADHLSRELNANAFTTGRDVFFREGDYQPGSPEGKRLLAHELTHVAQQSGSPQIQRQKAPRKARPRYRLVANLSTAQLTVFYGKNKVREMTVIFGRATSTLLKYKQLRIGGWREGFTTPSRTDYTACTWFPWGEELDLFPPVAFSGTGTAGTGVIKVRGRRYRVGTIVPGKEGEIYRHEPKWLKWETIEKYSNPFGKYATVIRGNFMLHGTDGADGLGGPFAALTTAEQRAKVTHGCIRTSNADIEWLKDNVPPRTTIKVVR